MRTKMGILKNLDFSIAFMGTSTIISVRSKIEQLKFSLSKQRISQGSSSRRLRKYESNLRMNASKRMNRIEKLVIRRTHSFKNLNG